MNQKELREIRKRFTLDKDSISHVYGCYVNAAKDIVARMDMSMGLMEQEEAELYLKLLKKSISGTLGKNLLDIEFSTKQVEDSDEHRLLQALRQSHLRDEDMRELFYKRVIESLDFGDDSYVILLASDSYDIPFKGRDDELWEEGSNEVFDYIICCICPVKDARASLRYFAEEQNFRGASSGHVLGNPELGFMFPSFDDRSTNIYNALFYSRKEGELHQEFIDAVFHTDLPMSAAEQREAFEAALSESLGSACSLEIVQAIHGQLAAMIEEHRETKDPEPLTVSPCEVSKIILDCGASEEQSEAFQAACGERFGVGAVLNPANLIDAKKVELKTEKVSLSIDPEYSHLVEAKVIDGQKVLIVPVEDHLEFNGVAVNVNKDKE